MKYSEELSKELGYTTAIAIVLDENLRSKSMFEKMNYKKWGILPSVAEIDGVKVDHVYFGKKLNE